MWCPNWCCRKYHTVSAFCLSIIEKQESNVTETLCIPAYLLLFRAWYLELWGVHVKVSGKKETSSATTTMCRRSRARVRFSGVTYLQIRKSLHMPTPTVSDEVTASWWLIQHYRLQNKTKVTQAWFPWFLGRRNSPMPNYKTQIGATRM